VTYPPPAIRESDGSPAELDAVRAIFRAAVDGGDALVPAPGTGDATFERYWRSPGARTFVALVDGRIAGSYLLRPNGLGLADHVANAGYIVDPAFRGRGIASAMCAHSLETARAAGFRAMQFNFVVSTNEVAVRLWERHGFAVVGRSPKAFRHAEHGEVDALIMHRFL
jgi:ribosomal protein S18 acetylase RimI-like enzyme